MGLDFSMCRITTPTEAEQNGEAAGTVSSEMDDVMARMRELATHRGDEARRSKRDRSALKTTFRELITTVEVSCQGLKGTPQIRLSPATM